MLAGGSALKVRIRRFDPNEDRQPYYETFEIPYQRQMRVLDVLDYIGTKLGRNIGHRWYCGVKKCGMCAMMMNGKPILSCWDAAESEMTLEPLAHFSVIRDLAVDFSGGDNALQRLNLLMPEDRYYQGFPEKLSHERMKRSYDLMKCIDCRVCVAACEVMGSSSTFLGPYGLVQLAKLALDPRHPNPTELTDLAGTTGIEECLSCNSCTESCPNGIDVLRGAIDQLREKMIQRGTYQIRGWRLIKRLPPNVRSILKCKMRLSIGEKRVEGSRPNCAA